MDAFLYKVIQLASMEDSQYPDYKQGFIALDLEDKLCASWDLSKGFQIQEKIVRATTPTKAILKFQRWIKEGRSDDYLLSF